MTKITASLVKELREMTGAGMMECKKALTETEGDLEAAVDVLRTRGLAAVEKKAGRATNEGTIMAKVAEDATAGVILELNCETDFVGMNEKFKGYADRIACTALANRCCDIDRLKSLGEDGETVQDILTDCIHVLGENTSLKRVQLLEGDAVCAYIHMGGKIGVLVSFDVEGIDPTEKDFTAYGRDIAMQVAALSPVAPNREAVPAEVVEHEMAIYKAQAAESGKPENIQEKIATGRMEKFYKEQCLTEQEFVKDSDQTVQEYTDACAKKLGGSIKIVNFIRFALGD